MNRHRHIWREVLFAVALMVVLPAVGGLSVAVAQSDGAEPNTIQPAIATRLKAAEELIAARKFQEAPARTHFRTADYPQVSAWASRYFNDGTADLARLRLIHAQRSSS
jgi:hypothetical protein